MGNFINTHLLFIVMTNISVILRKKANMKKMNKNLMKKVISMKL